MMIGRNWPLASEVNGFWNRATRKSPNEAAPELPAMAFAESIYWLAVSDAARMVGLSRNAITTPKIVAKSDVAKYHIRTLPPTRPDFFSGRLAAPRIRENRMIG